MDFYTFLYPVGLVSFAASASLLFRAPFMARRAHVPKKMRTFASGKDKGVSCPGCGTGGAEMIPSDLMQAMLP